MQGWRENTRKDRRVNRNKGGKARKEDRTECMADTMKERMKRKDSSKKDKK